jgi:hypothetical protein
MMLGLSAFDDAIDSDRKVWTSAAVGAAAGGLLGNLIGRRAAKASSTSLNGPPPPRVLPFAYSLPGSSSDGYDSTSIRDLRLRIRDVSSPARLAAPMNRSVGH